MNFLGHAVIASEYDRDDRFVLGAMLPDFASMVGLRLAEIRDPSVASGVALHHETDAVFHATPTFVELVNTTTAELREAGVRRGPARAVGHIGVELLLDGWWVRGHGVPAEYERALEIAPSVESQLSWRAEAPKDVLARACRRLQELEIAAGYADPALVTRRLERILSRRPRLAMDARDRGLIEDWTHDAVPRVAAVAPALWKEIRAGLERGRT